MTILGSKVNCSRTIVFVLCSAMFIVAANAVIAEQFIDPFWQRLELHVPGEESTLISHKVAVDTIFYVRNADRGFIWDLSVPTSLWFHPLLTWLVRYLPIHRSLESRVWLISLATVFISIPLVVAYTNRISSIEIRWYSVFLVPILPGAVGMVTGNAEWLCLLFTTLLLISILDKWPIGTNILLGGLAILAKPNALYIVPMIVVYVVYKFIDNREGVVERINAMAGLAGILSGWLIWIGIVDWNLGSIGGYWQVRSIGSVPLLYGPFSLIYRTVQAFIDLTAGEKLRYLTALSIPLIHLWILAVIPIRHETHRLSMIAAYVAMLLITFYINNPNKIVVYTMTFPAHFASGILFIETTLLRNNIFAEKSLLSVVKFSAGILYIMLCLSLIVFYLIGTPLEWYY